MRLIQLLFLLASITICLETKAIAQATLAWETTVRPEGSNLTSSEGATITRDAFQDPTGIAFSNNGKKVFASNRNVSGTHECIKQMNLGTPYDFRTASTVVDEASPLETKVGLSNDADIRCTDLRFNRDGTQLFVSNITGKIHGFDLAKPFDLKNLTYNSNVSADFGFYISFNFNNEGTKLFVLDGTQDGQHIDEYNLSTAYDLTSATLSNTLNLEADPTNTHLGDKDQGRSLRFTQDGRSMFVLIQDGDNLNNTTLDSIFQFRLTRSFDTSSASLIGSVTLPETLNLAGLGLAFSPGGDKLYIASDLGPQVLQERMIDGNSTDVVVQVNLSCNFGIAACVSDPTSGLATQIQLAKNNVSENSSVIFKRFEWIKRNRNRNNFNNFNASIKSDNLLINYLFDKAQDKAVIQTASIKKNSSKDKKNNWSYWSNGDLTYGNYHGKTDVFGTALEKPKDIITSGITFGVDKKNSKNNFYGYAIRYADGKARLGSSGDTLMDSTTLNYYFITPFNDNGYSNMVLGLSSLKYKLQTQGTVTGNRNGQQIFTTIDVRNDSEFGSFNFTPSFKLKYAITELSDFTEFMTNVSSGATNVIYGSEIFAAGDLATGILFNTDPFKYNNKTTSHNGGIEFVYDYSPDVNTDYSFSDTSNTELYEIEKYSQSNIRFSYGIEEVYENNLTLSFNYERLQHLDSLNYGSNDNSYSESFFLKVGHIKEEDYQLALSLDALQDYKLNSHYSKKLGVFDLDVDAKYNFTSVVPEYGALVQISNKF